MDGNFKVEEVNIKKKKKNSALVTVLAYWRGDIL